VNSSANRSGSLKGQLELNFELDGRDGHVSGVDRERGRCRDAALGERGILVVRFTDHRLTHELDAVRREIVAILAARRVALSGAEDPQ
jgi:very-short-patch-repair endonuclease